MSQYNTFNVKLSNSHLNKLIWGIKKVLSLNVVSNSNDKTNFSHKLLSTNTQVSKIHKAFANGSTANIKISTSSTF